MFQLHSQLAHDCFVVTSSLPLSDVLLMNDRQYPWLILVPRVENAREIIDLTPEQQRTLWQESAWISEILRDEFQAHKLNVAALGNMVPQLHVHHIARFTDDPAWPGPVWGAVNAQPYNKSEATARAERLARLILYKIRT